MVVPVSFSPSFLSLTNDIIENQEGGWKVVSDPNDPGGTTIAGVPLSSLSEYLHKNELPQMTPEILLALFEQNKDNPVIFRNYAYAYYWDMFWLPMKFNEQFWANAGNTGVIGLIYSCAINCGVAAAIKILQMTIRVAPDGVIGLITRQVLSAVPIAPTDFKNRWRTYYVQLVMHNAEAWETYYGTLTLKPSDIKPPAFKRWKDLAGWISRVDRA